MSKITQKMLKVGGSLTALLVLTGAQSASAITAYNLEWDGAPFGNSASATGNITLDETTLSNPGTTFSSLNTAGVTDLEVTVTGASSGNGTFDLNDFDKFNDQLIWDTGGNTLNLNQELISQGLADFNIRSFQSGNPTGTGPLELTTDEGSGDRLELQSITPAQAVPFEVEGTMGLVALGGFFYYRHWKKRKQASVEITK